MSSATRQNATSTIEGVQGKERGIGYSNDNEYDGQEWDMRPDAGSVVHGSI